MTNFYENGDKPLEIVSTLQWYIRNGGRDEGLREALVERGNEISLDAGATCTTGTPTGWRA